MVFVLDGMGRAIVRPYWPFFYKFYTLGIVILSY